MVAIRETTTISLYQSRYQTRLLIRAKPKQCILVISQFIEYHMLKVLFLISFSLPGLSGSQPRIQFVG
jgi:hypothetical protein